VENVNSGQDEVRRFLGLAEEYGSEARRNATGNIAGMTESGMVYAQLATASAISALAVAMTIRPPSTGAALPPENAG
jgi:hypothetical protein